MSKILMSADLAFRVYAHAHQEAEPERNRKVAQAQLELVIAAIKDIPEETLARAVWPELSGIPQGYNYDTAIGPWIREAHGAAHAIREAILAVLQAPTTG